MGLSEQFGEELGMIKKAPRTFLVGFVALAVLIGWTEYSFGFKELLSHKDDLIRDKDDTIKGLQQKLETAQKAPPSTPRPAPTSQPSKQAPPRVSGPAETHAANSPAVTGDSNKINYGIPEPKADRK